MKHTKGRNNDSRKDCTWFCKVMDKERIGTSNMFKHDGKIWCYTNGTDNNTVRQFYDQSHGVYVDGKFIERKDLRVGNVTRISATMGIARQAHYS